MANLKYIAYRTIFELLWASQLPKLIRTLSKSRGVIFTLHRVLPDAPADFSPNAILQVTPKYLEHVIIKVREMGLDIVSMDEAVERIKAPGPSKNKFVVFTFDDAYRDNLIHALPILNRHNCPFILYVPTALVDGVGEVWWQALEDVIAEQDAIALSDEQGEITYHPSKSLAEKQTVYDYLYFRMRKMPEDKRVKFFREFTKSYGLDLDQHCRDLIMDWSELKAFADEPMCTIGAHTVHHFELAKLEKSHAQEEITNGIAVIKAQFGEAPSHLSFPIGALVSAGPREYEMAKDLGLASAVTTLPGGLYHRHKDHLTSLPRISLNGNFQQHRYVEILATGAIFSAAYRR